MTDPRANVLRPRVSRILAQQLPAVGGHVVRIEAAELGHGPVVANQRAGTRWAQYAPSEHEDGLRFVVETHLENVARQQRDVLLRKTNVMLRKMNVLLRKTNVLLRKKRTSFERLYKCMCCGSTCFNFSGRHRRNLCGTVSQKQAILPHFATALRNNWNDRKNHKRLGAAGKNIKTTADEMSSAHDRGSGFEHQLRHENFSWVAS